MFLLAKFLPSPAWKTHLVCLPGVQEKNLKDHRACNIEKRGLGDALIQHDSGAKCCLIYSVHSISNLMLNWRFFVEDCGQSSSMRAQCSGVSQGCTLSPLLFVVVMSAVMHDTVAMQSDAAKRAHETGACI